MSGKAKEVVTAMISKEIKMDRFDAGKQMQDEVLKHQQETGKTRLQQLLDQHEEPANAMNGPRLSRSEEKYPQAYRGGVEEHWQENDRNAQAEVIRRQAIAQEKVGYEEDTQKFFIDDPNNLGIDPLRDPLTDHERLRVFGRKENAVPLETLNGPPLVFGGMLMGITLTLIVLITMGKLEVSNITGWYVMCGIGAAVGLMYAAQLRT